MRAAAKISIWIIGLLALIGCGTSDLSTRGPTENQPPTIATPIYTVTPALVMTTPLPAIEASIVPATALAAVSTPISLAIPLITVPAAAEATPTTVPTAPITGQTPLPRLVFRSNGLYVVNADGAGLSRLTTSPQDRLPAWSPDGQRIAFCSDRDDIGNSDISVINADGSGLVRLTTEQERATDATPFWSPDGQLIAFTSDRDSNTPYGDIYVMRPDGSQIRRLTTDPTFENIIGWSSDSRRIFYSINHEGAWTIHVINLDGTHDTVIVDGSPGVLSPDGTAIAFIGPEALQDTVWVSNVDGTHARRLADTPVTKYSLTWSPDSNRIALNPGIQVINTDGTGQIQLSDPQTSAGEIHWSPDGKYIAFQARNAVLEINLAVVDVTTGTTTIITPGMHVEAGFAWAPK